MMDLLSEHWKKAVEIAVLWLLIYQVYSVFRATRGVRILVGLAVVVIALTIASQALDLKVIEWIIKSAAAVLAFALLIIFQPELRNGLARLGSSSFFSFTTTEQQAFLDTLADSVVQLSKKRFGALFAIERSISLENFAETGIMIEGDLSKELAVTIFHPKTALHDGGMTIASEKVGAAGCIFPVSQKELNDRSFGLRHRAGLGVTEETDAVAIVVSEETGSISICIDGKIEHRLSEEEFRTRLADIFLSQGKSHEEEDHKELDSKAGRISSGDSDLVSD
ncbi:diadenylate cyclase CdaA [bacterium]|nr:diadenylate cyclase CdaA [Akkermansiaceae bacterium]MDB4276730.1 diadenylate cyclase CdaA [bacterium]MDA7862871.1 diadenylate cyclase CdaA [Akkermansiaceae bacterium]MDA7863905.1 diadenylate cyclase CdaA [Akkermansiaceae bacterium]MDB0056264.1 diadenylate cyclase CdaA [Akkermansiaceae bacterium]